MDQELYQVIQDVSKTNKPLAEAVCSMYAAIFETSLVADSIESKLGHNKYRTDGIEIIGIADNAGIDVDDPLTKAEKEADAMVNSLPPDAFVDFKPTEQEFPLPGDGQNQEAPTPQVDPSPEGEEEEEYDDSMGIMSEEDFNASFDEAADLFDQI